MSRTILGKDGWAASDQEAVSKDAKYALRSLNDNGSIYATDYHTDRATAELHGQMWVNCGGGGYRIDELVMQA